MHVTSSKNVDDNKFIAVVFSHSDKSLFVLPAFEINSKQVDKMPKDKSQVISLLNNGAVRPFYFDICWKCQRPTNYEKWQRLESARHFSLKCMQLLKSSELTSLSNTNSGSYKGSLV